MGRFFDVLLKVHCRIGSLEISHGGYLILVFSSLPRRQLKKPARRRGAVSVYCHVDSLERMHHFLHTSDYGLASFHPFLQNNILIHLLNYIFLLGLNHNL